MGNAINTHNISKHHKERFPTPAYLLNSTVPQRTNLLSLSAISFSDLKCSLDFTKSLSICLTPDGQYCQIKTLSTVTSFLQARHWLNPCLDPASGVAGHAGILSSAGKQN